jgi:hypothetical protein
MFRFVNWPQIVMWHNAERRHGPVSVLKQVEHTAVLIIEIQPSGRHKIKAMMEVDRRKK